MGMGVIYYAVDNENKTLFELGKGYWWRDTEEDIKEEIAKDGYGNSIIGEPYNVDDLKTGLLRFKDVTYRARVVDRFNKWKVSDNIYMVNEDYAYELEDIGYKQTATRYEE